MRREAAVRVQELRAHVQTETPPEESHDELRERAARVQLPVLQQAVPAKGPSENALGLRAQNHNVEWPAVFTLGTLYIMFVRLPGT